MPVAEAPQPITAEQEAEWQAKIDAAFKGKTPVGKEPESEPMTLGEALGEFGDMVVNGKDLWPGHGYIPPKIKQLRTLVPRVDAMFAKLGKGTDELMEAFDDAVEIIKTLCRRIEGDELILLTDEEIEEQFDEIEISELLVHIMEKQGIYREVQAPNSPSGRPIGFRSFTKSAAITEDTPSETAAN